MTSFDILDILEEQGVQLERARAVLREASRHTESVTVEPQISILTHVVDDYLINVGREIKEAIDVLYKQRRTQDTEESEETVKARAAFVLHDEILGIKTYLDRAEVALQEPTEDYFGVHDIKSEKGKEAILFDYERQGILCGVTSDYLFKIGKTLESLVNLANKGMNIDAKEKEAQRHE